RPRTWAREPARSSAARRWSKGRLTVKASSSSEGPPANRPCHRVLTGASGFVGAGRLAGRPRLHAEAPQAHEALAVGVVEAVGRVVGGEPVVVEAVVAAPADHVAAVRLQAQAHLAGDVPLRRVDERVERLLERREPQAVVDELGVAVLEGDLLALQVALEGDALEVAVRRDQRQRTRRLVGLPALDADTAVLHHVEPAPAVGPDDGVQLADELVGGEG